MKRISRGKKKKILVMIVSILVVVIGVTAAFIIGLRQVRAKYDLQRAILQQEIDSNKREVYLANGTIPAGTKITRDNIRRESIFSSQPQDYYMTDSDIDKIAAVDIADGQSIYASMVGQELEFGVREVEYALLRLSTNLVQNDFVDVRIMYPNGENYIVLAKKDIKQLDLSTNDIFLWLNEKEIMLVSSAIVDTYLHNGAMLYTTKYIEDSQEATTPTYIPTTDCMIAMGNDENIIDIATAALNASMRTSLDSRLEEYINSNNINLSDSIPNYQGTNETSNDGVNGVLSGVDTGESDDEDKTSDDSESLTYDYEEDVDNGY